MKKRLVGFVPTMGYLHEGHLTLLRQAKKDRALAVLSIFVNPLQFGPREDLSKYPRDLRRDLKLARSTGVDLVFAPSVEEMYPRAPLTFVEVLDMGNGLCGVSRPGHFRGVATVVSKLFNIVQPDILYLGQKDAQQAAILKKMAADLNFPVAVKICKTVRESDGLAMSSRNVYLSPSERTQAPCLYRALRQAKARISRGERDAKKIISEIKKLLLEGTSASIEYISCVDATDLKPIRRIKGKVLIALAVKFPSARLIDNIQIDCK